MKKIILLNLVVIIFLLGMIGLAQAGVLPLRITHEDTVPDASISGWYRWIYQVEMLADAKGVSHFVVELENCWLQGKYTSQILGSAGYEIVNPLTANRAYTLAGIGQDPTTGLTGIKWEAVSGEGIDELDAAGEIDRFYFSVPTDQSSENEAAAKAGNLDKGGYIIYEDVPTPACTDGGCSAPEPASLLLLGSGVLGLMGIFRKN